MLAAALPTHAQDPPPWLVVSAVPAAIVVDRGATRDDNVVSLELVSRANRAVRAESVGIVYLKGDAVLSARTPGAGFFEAGRLPRATKIEAGSRETWSAVCLVGLPADADGVRFDLSLAMRQGLQTVRSNQSIVVPVVSAPSPTPLRLPFRGHWRVTQGHGCGSNHRIGARGGEFAWDFEFLDRDEAARRAPDGASFGQEVLAPIDGRVVRVVADIQDNRGLTAYPRRSVLDDLERPDWVYGNYVVIEGAGHYVLLGHLAFGSLTVAVGERVAASTVVGRAGNSGNAISSHLHLHVMDRPDPGDPAARGLPARLVDYVEIRAAAEGDAKEFVVRRVAAGDPPEASIVTPDVDRARRARP